LKEVFIISLFKTDNRARIFNSRRKIIPLSTMLAFNAALAHCVVYFQSFVNNNSNVFFLITIQTRLQCCSIISTANCFASLGSSANFRVLLIKMDTVPRSSMYTRNPRGPRTVPCGNPDSTSHNQRILHLPLFFVYGL